MSPSAVFRILDMFFSFFSCSRARHSLWLLTSPDRQPRPALHACQGTDNECQGEPRAGTTWTRSHCGPGPSPTQTAFSSGSELPRHPQAFRYRY